MQVEWGRRCIKIDHVREKKPHVYHLAFPEHSALFPKISMCYYQGRELRTVQQIM